MIDLILQTGVSNVCVSMVLAVVAFMVHRTGRMPLVAHLLWVLVLVKLITPPLFNVPVVPVPGAASEVATDVAPADTNVADAAMPLTADVGEIDTAAADTAAGPAADQWITFSEMPAS